MAREFGKANPGLKSDPEYRALTQPAQHLYLSLWIDADITYCGVLDWRPARISGGTAGMTPEDVRLAAASLEARHFIVTDDDTEEVLIRSWVRWDGVMRKPRLAISFVKAYATTASETVRQAIVFELHKLMEREPYLPCWRDERVQEVLSHPATSAKELGPITDPFGDDYDQGLDSVTTAFRANAAPRLDSVTTAPTTSTSTSTSTKQPAKIAEAPEPNRFPEFWDVFDKKKDRKNAERKWIIALKKPGVTADVLICEARTYINEQRANNDHPDFTMAASKWLNGERWTDEGPRLATKSTDNRQMPDAWR